VDLDGEARDVETSAGQRLQIRELLEVTVANVGSGLLSSTSKYVKKEGSQAASQSVSQSGDNSQCWHSRARSTELGK